MYYYRARHPFVIIDGRSHDDAGYLYEEVKGDIARLLKQRAIVEYYYAISPQK